MEEKMLTFSAIEGRSFDEPWKWRRSEEEDEIRDAGRPDRSKMQPCL